MSTDLFHRGSRQQRPQFIQVFGRKPEPSLQRQALCPESEPSTEQGLPFGRHPAQLGSQASRKVQIILALICQKGKTFVSSGFETNIDSSHLLTIWAPALWNIPPRATFGNMLLWSAYFERFSKVACCLSRCPARSSEL